MEQIAILTEVAVQLSSFVHDMWELSGVERHAEGPPGPSGYDSNISHAENIHNWIDGSIRVLRLIQDRLNDGILESENNNITPSSV